MEKTRTKKAFREWLNQQDIIRQSIGLTKYHHNQYHQVSRLYGDYLYYQDRDMFNENYGRWVNGEYENTLVPKT